MINHPVLLRYLLDLNYR